MCTLTLLQLSAPSSYPTPWCSVCLLYLYFNFRRYILCFWSRISFFYVVDSWYDPVLEYCVCEVWFNFAFSLTEWSISSTLSSCHDILSCLGFILLMKFFKLHFSGFSLFSFCILQYFSLLNSAFTVYVVFSASFSLLCCLWL